MIKLFRLAIVLPFFQLLACSSPETIAERNLSPDAAFDSLLTQIERAGDFINSDKVPAMITAAELYTQLDSNILVIDTRTPSEFAQAHIPFSVNVAFNQLLNYFETGIDPNSFNKIAIVCNAGQTASYATSILRILGYENVFALKWGFSAWHRESAEKRWLARTSNRYSELLERSPNAMLPSGQFPDIETNEKVGYAILRQQAQELFKPDFNSVTISVDTLFESGHNFYIINYWPDELYSKGHIPGAIRYQPKKSLKRTEQLKTLPTDRPIVVYCYTGQHSSFVTAYLRLLGYDARTLTYGANGFMNGVMKAENMGNVFSEKEILDLPVSSGSAQAMPKELGKVDVKPRGGC